MNAMHLQHNRSVIGKEWTSIWVQHVRQIKRDPRGKVAGCRGTKCSHLHPTVEAILFRKAATRSTALNCDSSGSSRIKFYSPCSKTRAHTFSHTNNSVNKVLSLQSKPQAPDLRPEGPHVASTSLNMPSWDRGAVSDGVADSKRQRDWQEGKLD